MGKRASEYNVAWATYGTDKLYSHAFSEIKRQRDRGAGIIAAAILQDQLKFAIKTRFDKHPKLEAKMFKSDGPLGSFAA